jgi:hypothetical protein
MYFFEPLITQLKLVRFKVFAAVLKPRSWRMGWKVCDTINGNLNVLKSAFVLTCYDITDSVLLGSFSEICLLTLVCIIVLKRFQ